MAHASDATRFRPAAIPVLAPWLLGLLLLAACLVPLVGYGLLPLLGLGQFAAFFTLKKSVLLFGAVIGGVAYLYYLQTVLPRPQLLVAFIAVAWPLVVYVNGLLLQVGINVHLRPLLILAVALPAGWITLRHLGLLLSEIPWFKYYVLFFLWLVLYTVFFNANAVDPRLGGGEASLGEGSVSIVQLTAYFYCLMSITVSAVAGLCVRDYKGLFDTLNKALIGVSGLESLMTILGFPFGMFSLYLDGFTRAVGIFSHPNPFAHHMGILMVYLLGLFCYYQGERRHRMPAWLLLGGLAFNFVAFLLGLSKTALAVFMLCGGLLFMMNLAVPAVRRSIVPILLALIVLVPLGLFGFQALSDESFMSLIESRIEQTESLNWRTQIWQDLLAGIHPETLWLGHGFTAANATVFHLTFHDAKNAHPLMMVHNAYIALLYDLGLMGYSMFIAALSMAGFALRRWLSAVTPALRTEYSIVLALVVYFLLVCGFDEMSYMFDAPQLFWVLATLLACMGLREQREARIV